MPQFERYDNAKQFTAEGDITQFAVVAQGTADKQVKLPASTGDAAKGVAMHDADDGEQINVAMPGDYAKVIASAAISIDAWVKAVGTSGKVVSTTTQGDEAIGQAVTAASGDGSYLFIRIAPNRL